MKSPFKNIYTVLLLAAGFAAPHMAAATAFTGGNLAVLQADVSANNTTFSILELSPSTANQVSPVSSNSINGTTGNSALRISGSASTTGFLCDSDDGSLLAFAGVNTNVGTANANTILTRGVGTLDASGSFTLQMTYTGTSGQQTRGAGSTDNTKWYVGDQAGIYTNGATAAKPAANFRSVKSFGGTIYACQAVTNAAAISTISATTNTSLPGLPLGNSTNSDFYMISSGNNGSSFDILYVLSGATATAGRVDKYSLVAGSWNANGIYSTSFGGFAICAAMSGTGAVLYVTTGSGANTANKVIKLNDDAGYNATISISTSTTLYTAAAGINLKGIAFAPVQPGGAATVGVSGNLAFGNVVTGTIATAILTITNSGNIAMNVTNIAYPPAFSGAWPAIVSPGSASNVTVSFAPTAVQSYGGIMTVQSGATAGTNTITCSGTGVISVAVSTIGVSGNLAFGNVTTGAVNNAALTITNSGNAALNVTNIVYPAGFSGAWTGLVSPGSASNVTVSFAPVAVQGYGGTISVQSDAASGSGSISCSGAGVLPGVLLLNEIVANPPGTDDPREYVEIRGTPGISLTNVWLVAINGHTTGIGTVDLAQNLSSVTLGTNGLLLIGDYYGFAGTPYVDPIPSGTVLIDFTPENQLANTTLIANNSLTFMLVYGFTGQSITNLDENHDGVLDSTPWSSVIDSVCWKSAGNERVYSTGLVFNGTGNTPDAAVRSPTNNAANDGSAWYAGNLRTDANDQLGIYFTGSTNSSTANFPAGLLLTPGAPNFPQPNAAPIVTTDPYGWSRTAPVGSNITFDVIASQVSYDAGQTTTLYATNLPIGATFTAVTGAAPVVGTFAYTPTNLVAFDVFFVAVDSNGTNIQSVTISSSQQSIGGPVGPLSPGDLMFIGEYNDGSPDAFAMLALVDLPTGLVVYVTDNGWNQGTHSFVGASSTVGAGGEGLMALNIVSNIPAGTVIYSTITDTNGSYYFDISSPIPFDTNSVPPGTVTVGNFSQIGLAGATQSDGDQLTAFTSGTTNNPINAPSQATFMSMLDYTGGFEEGIDKYTANVPTGLTTNGTALTFAFVGAGWALNIDTNNARTKAGWLAYIAEPTNWVNYAAAAHFLPTGTVAVTVGNPGDTNTNGIPDIWELANFGNLTNSAYADTDGDGSLNIEEFIAGTQPTNALSFPRLDAIGSAGHSIAFNAVSGRVYQIEFSASVTNSAWISLSQTNVSTTGPITVTDPAATNGRSYRFRVKLP